MNLLHVLTEKNFLLYAAKNYENPACTDMAEFIEDLRRIKYTKKLITRYIETGELKERLILNHLIVLSNIFRSEPLVRILILKMEPQLEYIKPFLLMLGCLPKYVYNVKVKRTIDTDLIPMDQGIVTALRKI